MSSIGKETSIFDKILLIGPMACGKTTVSLAIANKLNIPNYCVDKIKTYYYYQKGYDELTANNIQKEQGIAGRAKHNKKYDLYATKKVIHTFSNCVIDFGAGQSCFLDKQLHHEYSKTMSALENVFMLLPHSDINISIDILRNRIYERQHYLSCSTRDKQALLTLSEQYLRLAFNSDIPKFTIYTDKKNPQQVAEEIIGKSTFDPSPHSERETIS